MSIPENKVVERPKLIPHQAIVRINAAIHQQLPNGQWHPRAVFNDGFILRLEGTTEKEVVDNLKERLETVKKEWIKGGGQIAMPKN